MQDLFTSLKQAPNVKKKMSRAAKRRAAKMLPIEKEIINAKRRATESTSAWREGASQRQKEWMSNPANKAKYRAGMARPEVVQHRSDAMRHRLETGNIKLVGKSGYFVSAKTGLTIYYHSTYELRLLEWCELNPYVTDYSTFKQNQIRFSYIHPTTFNRRWYYPDLLIVLRDGLSYVCEVKAAYFLSDSMVIAKAQVARPGCAVIGHTYIFIAESHLNALESAPLEYPSVFCV